MRVITHRGNAAPGAARVGRRVLLPNARGCKRAAEAQNSAGAFRRCRLRFGCQRRSARASGHRSRAPRHSSSVTRHAGSPAGTAVRRPTPISAASGSMAGSWNSTSASHGAVVALRRQPEVDRPRSGECPTSGHSTSRQMRQAARRQTAKARAAASGRIMAEATPFAGRGRTRSGGSHTIHLGRRRTTSQPAPMPLCCDRARHRRTATPSAAAGRSR